MASVPVVKVKHETAGFCLINASEFDPSIHTLYDEEKPPVKSRKPKEIEGDRDE